jgi:hypothetical protein
LAQPDVTPPVFSEGNASLLRVAGCAARTDLGQRHFVSFAGLGGERRQHQAICEDLVAGDFGDLAAAGAAEEQEADNVAERSTASRSAVSNRGRPFSDFV